MITRQQLQNHQQAMADAETAWERIATRAAYAQTLVSELMTVISETQRIWTANDLEPKLQQALASPAIRIGGMLPMQLLSFQGAMRAFQAMMQTPIAADATVAVIDAWKGVDAVATPGESWATTAAVYGNMSELEQQPLAIVERTDWVGAVPWAPAPPEPSEPA